jgi:shikimate dehydrogenase
VNAAASLDRYAVIGHPVAHSRSPAIHAAFAQATGQALVYGRLLAPLDGFAACLAQFAAEGGRGANVTVPFKHQAFLLCARRSARAEWAQAVNTLVRLPEQAGSGWAGDNTDGVGLVRDIEHNAGRPLAGARVLLVGAGGAAAGALGPLLHAGPAELVVANRTPAKALQLVARHQAVAGGCRLVATTLADCGAAYDVLINASASSLGGAAPPVPATALRAGSLALDMMYGPAAVPFLAWAEQHGATARDGLGMLVEQAAEAFFGWRGVRPDTAPVLAALRREIDAPTTSSAAA